MLFAAIAQVIEAERELHCPEDFQRCWQQYLDRPNVRETEPVRFCRAVGTIRDWHFGCRFIPGARSRMRKDKQSHKMGPE